MLFPPWIDRAMEYDYGFRHSFPLSASEWLSDGLRQVLLGSLPVPLEEELLPAGQLGNASLLQSIETARCT